MRYCLILFLVTVCGFAKAQKVDTAKYDPFDSVFTASSTNNVVTGMINTAALEKTLFVSATHIVSLKRRDTGTATILFFGNTPTQAITADNTSYVGVLFDDNSTKRYYNEAGFNIVAEGGSASLYFTIPKNDALLFKNVKSVRLQYKDARYDFDLANGDAIKKIIDVVERQPVTK